MTRMNLVAIAALAGAFFGLRKHITVFRLRHISDSFFAQLGHFFRYARHFDFRRLRRCTNSGQHPNWRAS